MSAPGSPGIRMSNPAGTLPPDGTSEESRELREELQRAVHPRYRVDHEIGHGGMAFVFQGWDTVAGRSVAFKVLKRQYATAMGPTRFLREIRVLSQLHHPGILPLLDSGHTEFAAGDDSVATLGVRRSVFAKLVWNSRP